MHSVSSGTSNVGLKQARARLFFSHYLTVRADQPDSTLSKSTIYALYKHMVDEDLKYDYANFSNALYVWTSDELVKVRAINSYLTFLIYLFQQPGGIEAINEAFHRFEIIKANNSTKSRKSKEKAGEVGEPARKRQRKQKVWIP